MPKVIPFFKTEYELATAIMNGEQKAYHTFYEKYSGKMLAICSRYIQDRMAAEDVMVEGIMKIFDKISKFNFQGSFEGWAKRIMVNEALMFLRSKKHFEVDIDEAQYLAATDTPITDEFEVEELIKIINELPTGYRTVFNLYAIEGYAHAEIAEMLGITESTSKSQLSRARMILQDKLKKTKPSANAQGEKNKTIL